MKHTMRVLGLALLAGICNQAQALEASASGGPQAAQAAVTSMNATTNAAISALQTEISGTIACNKLRKFYAPGDAKQDANGCVGIQDYQLSMNNTSGVNTTNGAMSASTMSGNAIVGTGPNGWGGVFNGSGGVYASGGNGNWSVAGVGTYGVYGIGTTGNGVQGQSTSAAGVYGASTNGWGGQFYGSSGVYVQSSSGWGGQFTSPNYGVYGSGATYAGYFDGPLCLNGSCINSWGQSDKFGGIFMTVNGSVCYQPNVYTGGCNCPVGYNQSMLLTGSEGTGTNMYMVYCYH
jgi:hypothetical protein